MRLEIPLISVAAVVFAPIFANAANINTGVHSAGCQIELSAPGDVKASSADYHLLKRSDEIEDRVEYLGDELESLRYRMMSIIGPMGWSLKDFDENAVDHAMQLLDLDLSIKQISPPDAPLLRKLEHTKRVSREITEAVLLQKIFKKAGVKEYDILMNVIETDLNILRYLNTSGEPNTRNGMWFIHGAIASGNNAVFALWLRNLKSELEDLKRTFASMEISLNVVSSFFDDRAETISRKLQELSDFYDSQVRRGLRE